jgi:Family of unknown function (DUF6459)
MPAEQTKATHSLPDPDPASMGLMLVPDVSSPPDGTPDAAASPSFGLDRPAVPRVTGGHEGMAWQRQFAVLLAEALAGVRPLQQVLPWMSERGSIQLRRLLPLFCGDHRPRIVRVLTATPKPGVIEMTIVITAGPRTRALAVRLERAVSLGQPAPPGQATWRGKPATPWLCTAVEAG